MTLGERIKILRLLSGYSQDALAQEAGVSRVSVNRWEAGKLPTPRITELLSRIFNVESEYLLRGTHFPTTATWRPQAPGNPKYLNIMRDDLMSGLPSFFGEGKINCAAVGKNTNGETFIWLGNNDVEGNTLDHPFLDDEKVIMKHEITMNYLILIDDPALNTILAGIVRQAVEHYYEIGELNEVDLISSLINASLIIKSDSSYIINVKSIFISEPNMSFNERKFDRSVIGLLNEFSEVILANKYTIAEARSLINIMSERYSELNTRTFIWSGAKEMIATSVHLLNTQNQKLNIPK